MPTGMILRLLAGLLALAAGAALAGADEILRWEEIEARLDQHPALAAARANVSAADGELRAARQLPNPELELGGGRAEANAGGETDEIWDLALTLPLRPWGPYRHALASANAARDARKQEHLSLRREVARQLRSQFWRIAHDQLRLGSLARSQDQFEQLVRLARLRSEAGEARPLDPLRLEIELEKLSAEIRSVHSEARLNRKALRSWIAPDLPEAFQVETDWDHLPELPPLAGLQARVTSTHPGLKAAELEFEQAGAELRAERAERLPGLHLGGFVAQELDARNTGLTLSVELPLWNWNGGGIARARAEREVALHRRSSFSRELEQNLAEAHTRAQLARETRESYRRVILPKSIEAVRALDRMYQVGEVGILDLLVARRDLIETEMEMLAANLAFHLAMTDLNALIGGVNHE